MTTRKRKGMLIKNTNVLPVEVEMATRMIHLDPGEEQLITAEEVRDPALRQKLQVRAVSIVRPSEDHEEEALREQLGGEPMHPPVQEKPSPGDEDASFTETA